MAKNDYNIDNSAIQLFEGKKVRIAWDAEQEKYFFAVADIVQVVGRTLMIAESKTEEKDVMVKVVVNLINQKN